MKTSIPVINLNFIKRWNDKRTDEPFLKSFFEQSGNKFSFTKEHEDVEKLHVYLALNSKEELNFYFIKEKDDAKKRFNWLASSNLSSNKGSLPPPLDPSNETSKPAMPYGKAKEWIENWIDTEKRNEWIASNFNANYIDNTIMLAFVISTADFNIGAKHECFLALKKVKSVYVADLIVYNTENKEIVNREKSNSNGPGSLEVSDLARPVPPFGDEYDEFGALIELGIQ